MMIIGVYGVMYLLFVVIISEADLSYESALSRPRFRFSWQSEGSFTNFFLPVRAYLFAPTCSSPKKPTWNEQVDISRSIKYPTGRSCFVYLTCPISTCWVVLAAEINVPPGPFDVLALAAIT